MKINNLKIIIKLLIPFSGRIILLIMLSSAAFGAHSALMISGAWILAHAAFMPSIAEIQVAIVAVRFCGLSRAVLRYLERLFHAERNSPSRGSVRGGPQQGRRLLE